MNRISKLESDLQYLEELSVLVSESEEVDLYDELLNELPKYTKQVEQEYLNTLLSGKYDSNNCIMTIHSGAGGTESQDWADMLKRMYFRYAERRKLKLEVLDCQDGDVCGIKSITFSLSGENAYGYLKCEKGVHRLVRISPFDSNSRRHTSFSSVEVIPQIESDNEIIINPEDVRIDTFRASGAGGQHINKTDSAIRITHFPTGIVVSCQTQRSQLQNKETCWTMLKSKLAELKAEEEESKLKEIQGSLKKIEWGSQIRSYVFCPYTMVKDHRTNYECSDVNQVMDGDLQPFINEYLKKSK